MTAKSITYFSFKLIVTVILVYIGFLGIIRSVGLFYSYATISQFPLLEALTFGVFINSCLFLAMAVSHNFYPVSKLLKASLLNFWILILLPCLFCLIITASHGTWSFLLPFLLFCGAFILPIALVLLSNKLTYSRLAPAS